MTNEEKYQNSKMLSRKDKAEILRGLGWEESWDENNWVRSDSRYKEANTGISLESAYTLEMRKKYPKEIVINNHMTITGFNEKYRQYLESGHYGLAISSPAVIEYLDKKFQELIQIPGFSYSQIKLKFNMARFYCEPSSIDTFTIEKEINEIIKNEI